MAMNISMGSYVPSYPTVPPKATQGVKQALVHEDAPFVRLHAASLPDGSRGMIV